ncbi:ABC transporter substrate-binding protein [Marinobacter sp.]|uniref:ABC transporter substrate-binding protein n=1 Tax=Marinobacter sp. TaxID=50741 RepID=UPI00385074F3
MAQEQPGRAPHDSSSDQISILLAGSGNYAFNERFLSLLQQEVGPGVEILEYTRERGNARPRTLVISLGARALSLVQQQQPRPPTLALMITERQFSGYLDRKGPPLEAVYHNPPLLQQALLGQLILPQSSRISLLIQPGQETAFEKLISDLKAHGIDARLFFVSGHDSLIPALSRALDYGDFLLAHPDDAIFNSRTIKHILLTAYRRNRIVIGPDRAFVRAGALASTYTPIPDVITEAARHIEQFRKTGALLPTGHPENIQVEVNQQVGRSLNIPLPDTGVLRARLLDLLEQGRENTKETRQGEPL